MREIALRIGFCSFGALPSMAQAESFIPRGSMLHTVFYIFSHVLLVVVVLIIVWVGHGMYYESVSWKKYTVHIVSALFAYLVVLILSMLIMI